MTIAISPLFLKLKEKIDRVNPFILAMVLFVIFFFLPLIAYHNIGSAGADIAEYLNNSLRVINGELPYRDFWLLHPPGKVFLPAFIYNIFGLNINYFFIFYLFISAFVGLFSFILGRLIFRDNLFAIISVALVIFSDITYYCLGNSYMNMYLLFLIISAYFLIKYLRKNNAMELFLGGVFVGLAFLFILYEVQAAFFASVLAVLINSRFNRKSLIYSIKSLALFCGGIFLVMVPVLLILIKIWQPMTREILFQSLSHGLSMNLTYFHDAIQYIEYIFADLKRISEIRSIFYVIDILFHYLNLIKVSISYLLPFFIAGVSIYYLFGKKLEKFDRVIILYFLSWGIFTFPKALVRSDMPHLVTSVIPLFFLTTFLLKKIMEKLKGDKTSLEKFIAYGLTIIIFLLLIPVLPFFLKSGYALTKPHYEVKTKYGTLFINEKREARDINTVIDFINKKTKEGDYIFVTPWFAPAFYVLTHRKNPTYYDSLVDMIARPSYQKQVKVCNDLLNKKTKLIVHYPDWGFDNKKERQFLNTCQTLQKCIEDNFILVQKYGYYWIYLPKENQAHN